MTGKRVLVECIHPLVKLVWLLVTSIIVFVVSSPGFIWVLVACLVLLGHAFWEKSHRMLRITLFSVLGLFLLQAIFYREGTVLFYLWPGNTDWGVTLQGVLRGARISGRFASVILASQVFVRSTDSSELAYSLMQAGVPYRFGFALVSALRMMPIFRNEGQTVYEAQVCRGVALDGGGFRGMLIALRRFLLPLIVSALRRVDSLSISMEGRHFGRYRTRTYAREVRFRRIDYVASALLFCFLLLTFFLSR